MDRCIFTLRKIESPSETTSKTVRYLQVATSKHFLILATTKIILDANLFGFITVHSISAMEASLQMQAYC
jgi:hypothetical protein